MPEHLIDAYIEYLRNVSRKIISKAGFEDIFPLETIKRKHYYTVYESELSELIDLGYLEITTDNLKFYRRLKVISNYLENETEYKLFIGSGLIVGKFKNHNVSKFVCSPLFYCPVELDFEEKIFSLDLDYESVQLNQDLMSRVFDIIIDEEIDEESEDSNDYYTKFQNIETIETKYSGKAKELLKDSSFFKSDLTEIMADFKIVENSIEPFEIKSKTNEIYKNLDKPKYFNHTFLFVNRVPHELSSYEALNTLLKKEKPLKNKLLNNLFINILTDKKVRLNSRNDYDNKDIFEIINKYIPLTLSENQKTAIQKAWNSELSYIQGPPGTGKSYTISALILSAIFLKKKILFVSHKEAAVKIVKDMIDNLLGNESLLYIGTHINSKKKTKEYLEKTIAEAESLREGLFDNRYANLTKEIDSHNNEINRLYSSLRKVKTNLSDFVKAENDYYKIHEEFIKKRNAFSKSYNVDNINDVEWKTQKLNKNKYIKFINKFSNYLESNNKSRLDIIYATKFLKHFKEVFSCDLAILKHSESYAKDVLELHSVFSSINSLLNRIKKNDLNILRKNVDYLENELNRTLKIFLPKFFKHLLLTKLIGDEKKELRDEVVAFKGMLHFKKAKILHNKILNLDYQDLITVFPLWCAELRDLGRSVALESELFDLVVVDEASQVNISEIIPAFYRAKQICVVGDKEQLNLNATGVGFQLSKTFDKLAWQNSMVKHQSVISYDVAKDKNLIVTQSSILDFVSSDSNDFVIPTTMLDEHYRSFPELAKFTSKLFYDNNLLIMTENGENVKKMCFKAIKVNGIRDTNKKLVRAEINAVINLLSQLRIYGNLPELVPFKKFKGDGENFSIGILSFLTHQVAELRNIIELQYEDLIEKHKIFIATPEEFQGNERDVMIITFGLDGISKWGKGFYENKNRFNVATSRAKYFTYVIYAGLPHNIDLIQKYLSNFGVSTDSFNDMVPTISYKLGWKFDPKNIESDFEYKVYNYLEKYKKEVDPNIEIYNQVNACGQKRLDFVLFNPKNDITCAVEVDGKDHFNESSYKYNQAHINRMEILKRAGWKIINLKYYNWWDNGWLCDENIPHFKIEIEELFKNLSLNLNS